MDNNSLNMPRPKRNAQPNLEPCDRDHVRPGPTVENSAETYVRDAGTLGDTSKTALPNRFSKGEREQPRYLRDRVSGFEIGPVVDELTGSSSDGARHDASVSQAMREARNSAALLARFEEQIASYRPRIQAAVWAEARPVVVGWMRKLGPMDEERTERFIRNLAHLAAHAIALGWALQDELVLSEEFILHFTDTRTGRTGASRPQDLSVLRQARRTLLSGATGDLRDRPAKVRTSPLPYTTLDFPEIEQWALSRKDARHRRVACSIVALVMGAGLDSHSVRHVSANDIRMSTAGLSVRVQHGASRTVPILDRWHGLLAEAFTLAAPGQILAALDGAEIGPKGVGNYVSAHDGPSLTRMRVTWVVSLVQSGTPIDLVRYASGNKYLDWLLPYLDHVERDPASVDSYLRGRVGSK